MNDAQEQVLLQIEGILNQLIENAELLKGLSKQVIAQEELKLLQTKQEKLIAELTTFDVQFHTMGGKINAHRSPTQKRIDEKLQQFQQLNMDFIENLSASHGLIKFEIQKDQKRKE